MCAASAKSFRGQGNIPPLFHSSVLLAAMWTLYQEPPLDDHGAAIVPLDCLDLHEIKIKFWLPKILLLFSVFRYLQPNQNFDGVMTEERRYRNVFCLISGERGNSVTSSKD